MTKILLCSLTDMKKLLQGSVNVHCLKDLIIILNYIFTVETSFIFTTVGLSGIAYFEMHLMK